LQRLKAQGHAATMPPESGKVEEVLPPAPKTAKAEAEAPAEKPAKEQDFAPDAMFRTKPWSETPFSIAHQEWQMRRPS